MIHIKIILDKLLKEIKENKEKALSDINLNK